MEFPKMIKKYYSRVINVTACLPPAYALADVLET
jgi:hypothetical protein